MAAVRPQTGIEGIVDVVQIFVYKLTWIISRHATMISRQ